MAEVFGGIICVFLAAELAVMGFMAKEMLHVRLELQNLKRDIVDVSRDAAQGRVVAEGHARRAEEHRAVEESGPDWPGLT